MVHLSGFVFAFFMSVLPVQAATESLVYRHDQWPLTVIEFRQGKTGPASRYAYRYSWPQRISDAYGLYDAEGASLGEATFSGRGVLASTFGGAHLVVTAPDGATVGLVDGVWSTWHRSCFTISDAAGRALAVAFVSYGGDEVLVVDAATQRRVLATLTYLEPWPSVERAYWTLKQFDTEALPPELAHALVAYVVDYRAWIAPLGMMGHLGEWLTGKKSLIDLLIGWTKPFPMGT